jgi:hypothetical protein
VIQRAVSTRHAAASLAELNQWYRQRASATQRVRFLRAYLAYRYGWSDAHLRSSGARATLRQVAAQIERFGRRHAARLHAQRDRRIFGRNRYFATAEIGDGWIATFCLRFRRRDLPPHPSQPDRPLAEWIAWVAREFPDLSDDERCGSTAGRLGLRIIRCRAATGLTACVWAIRGSPNRRAFRRRHAMRNRDLPIAAPIALIERRSRMRVLESVLLLEPDNGGRP